MGIKRKIRKPLPMPTAEQLRALLKRFGMQRRRAAEIMGVSLSTFHKYAKPATSRSRLPIPRMRFQVLKLDIGKLNDLYT